MATDDTGQNDPSIRPVPQYGEQSQDALLGQPQGDEPELYAYGLRVQGRPAEGRKSAEGSAGATVVAERTPRWEAIIATVFCGGIAALAPLDKLPRLVNHVPVAGVAAYLVLIAAASIWGCSRGWRMGLRMDDAGVTVRNYFRTYRISWPGVSRFADGAGPVPEQGKASWALSVVLDGGRAVTASGTTRHSPAGRR